MDPSRSREAACVKAPLSPGRLLGESGHAAHVAEHERDTEAMREMGLGLLLTIALLFTRTAEAGPGSGSTVTTTPCTQERWDGGACSLVVVTNGAYGTFGPVGSWVGIPLENPQRGGGQVFPFERGQSQNGGRSMRFDTRDFEGEMDATCPTNGECGMAFYYASSSSSQLVRIWAYREMAGNPPMVMVNSFDPSTPSSWGPVPSYAVSYNDPTPTARRMNVYIDGWGESWLMPSPTNTLFSAQQPGWRSTPL